MAIKVALLGNPNSGKTTLYNRLTGSNAHVGNWPGVTVERRMGVYKSPDTGIEVEITDLPGVYSLSPYTPEEVISRDYITSNEPDLIINIVDATNLERNLYLTTQALEMDVSVIVALNMMDMLEKEDRKIDIQKMSERLGVPVIPISATTGKGIKELMDTCIEESTSKERRGVFFIENAYIHKSVVEIQKLLENEGVSHPLYYAVKYIDQDKEAIKKLSLEDDPLTKMQKIGEELAQHVTDPEAAIADGRYSYITKHISSLITEKKQSEEESLSAKIDTIFTHRIWGIPIFVLVMFLMFHITFSENLFFTGLSSPGQFLHGGIDTLVNMGASFLSEKTLQLGAAPWLVGLVFDGIFIGVGTVISFLPLILMLYLFISILEDTGYMARVAFIMDRLLRKIGLSGKALLPLIMGFGCTVPAVAATRTLENEKDRIMTIMLIPFMSCGAKLPIYALIVPIFFPNHTDLVVTGIYFLGIAVAILAGFILKKTLFKGEDAPFVLELPPYRLPSLRSTGYGVWMKMKDFVIRAGTVIAMATIVIWFLSNFGFDNGFGMVEANSAISLLGRIGNVLKYIFLPLGFTMGEEGWKAAVAVIAGLIAKEAVVSTMGQLYQVDGDAVENDVAAASLATIIASIFSIPAALSFITWNLLSTPCMAAVGMIKQELNSKKWFAITMIFHFSVAWMVSFLVYWVSKLLLGI